MAAIGTRTPHVDWLAITGGGARYAADISLDGELIAAVLRSPHAHARIVDIDVTEARSVRGVHAILTAADVTEELYLDYRPIDRDRRILAREVVRYIGEPVALVAAEDAKAAAKALSRIRVKYKQLPAATSVAQARGSNVPNIHPHPKDKNVAFRVNNAFGADAKSPVATAHSVSTSYRSTRQTHATMEPHTVKAHWRPEEGCLHVWAPSQNPRLLQRDLAQLFGLAAGSVHMHELTVGGDFGGRTQISSTEALACALSLATARPVALSQSRAEEFAFTKWRLSWDMDLDLGCDVNGKLTQLAARFDVDNGAYNQAGPGEMVYGAVALGSSYRWLSYKADGRCIYTNKPPASSFRGAGGYAVNWSLECAIDELADAAGIDPIDFRLMNALSDKDEVSLTGWKIKSSGLRQCLEAVCRGIDWESKRRDGGRGRGVGVACTLHVTALSRDYMLRSSSALDIGSDGHIRIRSGCGDSGNGQKTLICQTVSEVLGVALDRISIVTTDTQVTPHDAGAGASRGSFVAVNAARLMAEKTRVELSAVAAAHFGVEVSDVDWREGAARQGNHVAELGDLAVLAAGADAVYSVEAEYVGASHAPDPSGYEDISPTYSFAAHAVEVEVDENTGLVRVVKVVAAHDSGTILNPISARGQVEGGVVMGLGAVLGESLLFEEGRVVNASYADYVLPRASDSPPIETIFIDSDDRVGPYGAKGLGEIPLITIGPAVTNAIAHAIGVRLKTAPHTPDQVLEAVRQRDGRALRAGSIVGRPGRWWVELVRRLYPLGLHKVLNSLPDGAAPMSASGIDLLHQPDTLNQALELLQKAERAAPLAGGTDLLALEEQGLPIPAELVDVSRLVELSGLVERNDGGLSIGAAVTLADLADSPLCDPALRETINQIATPQIRHVATVAGNLCQTKRCWFFRNGFNCYKRGGPMRPCYAVMGDHRFYHAIQDGHRCQAVTPSDLATTLVALDADAIVESADAGRRVSLQELYKGPGETVLRQGELISAIEIPAEARQRKTLYRKLALWNGAFAIATICVSARLDRNGVADELRVVMGGVASKPHRDRALEALLVGQTVDARLIDQGVRSWLGRTHPLDNNHWKAFATANLLRQSLLELFEEDRQQCN